LANNTIVLLTSDNGGVNHTRAQNVQTAAIKAGLKVNGPFRGGKHNVWEGGFRVPYIVRWPGRVPAGTSCDEMLSLADTLATVAGLLGAKLPPQGAAVDSYDMSGAWLGVEHKTPIRPNLIVHSADGVFAIRRGPWKWIEGAPAKGAEAPRARADEFHTQLYNLEQDLTETKDLAATQTAELEGLKALLNQQRDQGFSSQRRSLAE
jgi:arylsulfatase A-like enzyme